MEEPRGSLEGGLSPFGAALIPLGIWEREEVGNEVFLSIPSQSMGKIPHPPIKTPTPPMSPTKKGKGLCLPSGLCSPLPSPTWSRLE